ncbi:hypothetical protein [Streptomyces alboniger]|uniref:Uncharacterized protein n=1 Tax=Streptomyces alboniger TaxID=132473 RepID=A0A5J6HU27_STRAD|nr:hypothetical protein [Streptomyces alboniger]QEV21953.1 hypothetical protein CP975_34550 [Streptomyces alboniger]
MADPLTAAQQQVQKYRDLLRDNPQSPERNTWRDGLASALCDRLTPALRPIRPDEAAAAAREGIGITRELLAEGAFPQSRQGFAKRISEAAGNLPAAEAVTATEAAVVVYRQLAAARPDDMEPLASVAGVLAARLAPRQAAAGQTEGAAASAREAVAITRRLLAAPTLPPNAAGYAQQVALVARYLPDAEAVSAIAFAVDVYRRLADADPGNLRQRDLLAGELADRLAPRQWAAGMRTEAAASAAEAIQITKVVIEDPAVAAHLRGHGRRILMVAQYLPEEEMLRESEFAVGLYRRVTHQDPHNEGFTRDLVWAMGVWADRLERAGQRAAAAALRSDAAKAARYGEHSLAGQDIRFSPGAPISVVARNKMQLDLFAVGEDGRMWSVWWHHRWEPYFQLGTKTFPQGTVPCAVARDVDFMDVFTVDGDGRLCNAWWSAGDAWKTEWPPIPGGGVFPALTPVTALSRNSDLMDVWLVGADGVLNGVWWNGEWKDWYVLPGPKFPHRAPITSLSRNDDHMEVWGIDEAGAVWGIGWNGTWDTRNWTLIGGKTFPPGSRIAAASRDTDKMEIWVVDEQGAVWGNWWDDGWHDWYPIPGMTFPQGTPLTAISRRDGSHLELYGVGADGCVYNAYFDGNSWNHPGEGGEPRYWFRRGEPKDTFPLRTPLAAQLRHLSGPPQNLTSIDVFGVGGDAGIHSTRWIQEWRPWYRIPVPVARFQKPIVSGGAAALGGWAGVNICIDGSVQWYGHAHDSGADGYDFGVAFYVRSGRYVIALSHNGSVSAGSREHDWEEIHPPRDDFKSILSDLVNAEASMNMQYTSHIGQTLEGVVTLAVKWVVGTAVGVTAGVVIFFVVEVGSLVYTGSFGAGSVVLENILWFAGPGNTLLAVAAAGIAELAFDHKEFPIEAYRLINDHVFDGTLPERDRLRITNISGNKDVDGWHVPFVMPSIDGRILLNLGEAGFADPVNLGVGRGGGGRGHAMIPYEVLVHELVHAWQIDHTGFALSWLADALSSSLDGPSAYEYGPPGPEFASGFTIEGQAAIVQDWFYQYARNTEDPVAGFQQLTSNEAVTDPYFRYIHDNIRTGAY